MLEILVLCWSYQIHYENLRLRGLEGTCHYSDVLNLYLKTGNWNTEENEKLKKQTINSMNLHFILLSASHTTIFLSYCFQDCFTNKSFNIKF